MLAEASTQMTPRTRQLAFLLLAELHKDNQTFKDASVYGNWHAHLTDHLNDDHLEEDA